MRLKKRQPNKLMTKFYLIVLCGLICASGVGIYTQLSAALSMKKEIRQLEEELARERKNSVELANELEYYHTDSYIEKTAMKRLNLVKPNQILFNNTAK